MLEQIRKYPANPVCFTYWGPLGISTRNQWSAFGTLCHPVQNDEQAQATARNQFGSVAVPYFRRCPSPFGRRCGCPGVRPQATDGSPLVRAGRRTVVPKNLRQNEPLVPGISNPDSPDKKPCHSSCNGGARGRSTTYLRPEKCRHGLQLPVFHSFPQLKSIRIPG